jgi:hypothetical protein
MINNTQFLSKVESTSKEIETVTTAIITTISCIVVTFGLIRSIFKK